MLTVEQKAQNTADALGISFYITQDGRITQNNEDGLSREIRPRDGATPIPHAIDELKKGED